MPGGISNQAVVQVTGSDDKCCGVSFLKNLLYIYNFLLLASGLALLGIGVLTFLSTLRYMGLLVGMGDYFVMVTYMTIGTGAVIILLFIIGCCATCNKNTNLLILFSVSLLIIFLLEIGTGSIAYFYDDMIKDGLSSRLQISIMNDYHNSQSIYNSINHLQTMHRCCGSYSFADWEDSDWSKNQLQNATVPDSCCKSPTPACGLNTHPSNINVEGCAATFHALIHQHLIIIGGVTIGLCCLKLFGMIFACCFIKRLQRWKSRYHDYWR